MALFPCDVVQLIALLFIFSVYTGFYSVECTLKRNNLKLILQVKYPTSQLKPNSEMWLRGNGLGLSWKQAKKMLKTKEKDTWNMMLEYNVSVNGYTCEQGECILKQLEFRVYLDNEKDMIGTTFVAPLPISKTQSKYFQEIPTVTRFPWFFNKMGKIVEKKIYSQELQEVRSVISYLPPSFEENKYKKYETLFVHDGDVLNSSVIPVYTLIDGLIAETRQMREVVLIGIRNNQTERTALLSPVNGTDLVCRNGNLSTMCNGCFKCGVVKTCNESEKLEEIKRCMKTVPLESRGEQFLDFIVDTLLPNASSWYRTFTDRDRVGIMGYSLGGLMSCYSAWTRAEVFGVAACMSSSFWWPSSSWATAEDSQFYFINNTLKTQTKKRPHQKIYIDVGSDEPEDLMRQPARTVATKLAAMEEFDINENLWLFILDAQAHNMLAWYERMWMPLLTLYASESIPRHQNLPTKSPTNNSTATKLSTVSYFLSLYVINIIFVMRML